MIKERSDCTFLFLTKRIERFSQCIPEDWADGYENVTLTGGLVLQTLETWQSFIHTSDVTLKSNSGELYFETEDMDAFYKHLESFDILYVHKLHEHPWGQRVVRF